MDAGMLAQPIRLQNVLISSVFVTWLVLIRMRTRINVN